MKRIKCECGHINHEGTVLCEACGKPIEGNQHIDGNDKKELLNMRYEGSARRSQTYNRTLIDKIWGFFSSVKVGVWLIVITLIASAIGTIYPQYVHVQSTLPASVYYEQQYGLPGKIYYQLGFHEMYTSWWYIVLLALIGISLVICSIDRYVPLRRALKNQKPKRNEIFIRRQRMFSESVDFTQDDKENFIKVLKDKGYKISEQDGHVLAEKNRFSRWGPYVNHIGLIIILLAAILRMFPFMYVEDYVWVREGETKVIPGTGQKYYVENEKFIYEVYDRNDERFQEALKKLEFDVPSNFQTNAVIYKVKEEVIPGQEPELVEVTRGEIRLNEPIKFDGYALYQAGTQLQSEYKIIEINIETQDGTEIGQFVFDTGEDRRNFELNSGYEVKILEYYPQFDITEKGPSSSSPFPRNPALIFAINTPDGEEERFFYLQENILPLSEQSQYKVEVEKAHLITASGLLVKLDRTLWIFGVGAIIFMIGVVQGMYWHHRRVWIHPKDDKLLIAAHTNKNWYALKKEIELAMENTRLTMVNDQQELDRLAKED